MRPIVPILVLIGFALDARAPAQPTAPASTSALLKQAREARAAGRGQEAARLADQMLATNAGNREVVALRIDLALETNDLPLALETYDRYARAARREDAPLLASIARAEWRRLSTSDRNDVLRVAALEHLARAGDRAARRELNEAASGDRTLTGQGLVADASLARLGDPGAIARLGEFAQAPATGMRIAAIEGLKSAKAYGSGYLVRALLDDPNPPVKAAAADALGFLQIREAVPQLKALLDEPLLLVRLSAAGALKRLGDRTADALLAESLKSDVPDIRLLAALAYADGPTREWVPAIRPLLADPNGLTRLRAAELLLPIEAPAARRVLNTALDDPNPNVRAEATRILAAAPPYDLARLRPLLRDQNPWTRLHAAAAIVAAAGV